MKYYWKPNIKNIRYCTLFCDIKNIFLLQIFESTGRLLTDTTLPIPIRGDLFTVFVNVVSIEHYNHGKFAMSWFSFFGGIILHSTSDFNGFKRIMVMKNFIFSTRCGWWVIIHWFNSRFLVFNAKKMSQNPSYKDLSPLLVPSNMLDHGRLLDTVNVIRCWESASLAARILFEITHKWPFFLISCF